MRKVNNNMKIGLDSKYSRRVETPKLKGGKRILMTCGGGMAGSKWYEYATDIDMEGEFVDVLTLSGHSKLLGKNHIVKIEDVDFHGQVLDYEGKVTIEWYDVLKGSEVEYIDTEYTIHGVCLPKPSHSKSLPNYYDNKKVLRFM